MSKLEKINVRRYMVVDGVLKDINISDTKDAKIVQVIDVEYTLASGHIAENPVLNCYKDYLNKVEFYNNMIDGMTQPVLGSRAHQAGIAIRTGVENRYEFYLKQIKEFIENHGIDSVLY